MEAKIIRTLLIHQDKTISDLAEALGKSQANFSQMLRRDNFRAQELREIAEALGYDLTITWTDKKTGQEFS